MKTNITLNAGEGETISPQPAHTMSDINALPLNRTPILQAHEYPAVVGDAGRPLAQRATDAWRNL
jgi:hypothetical protein